MDVNAQNRQVRLGLGEARTNALQGATALATACQLEKRAVGGFVELFLQHGGDANIRDFNGISAWHHAVNQNVGLDVIQMLQAAEPDKGGSPDAIKEGLETHAAAKTNKQEN